MKPLIDADVLRYEIGFSAEYVDENGEVQIREWEFVQELFDQKIKEICEEVWATEPPTLYLTMDRTLHEYQCRRSKEGTEYVPNFREKIATKKPYKGQRSGKKPFHYLNLTTYILDNYDCKVGTGIEADDLITIDHLAAMNAGKESIICTRDKDLRMTKGMHFGWPCGKQPQFGPVEVDEIGWIELKEKSYGKEIKGVGLKFFYSQLLTGDAVDNIPGLPRCGAAKAFEALEDKDCEADFFRAVADLYEGKYGDGWRDELNEQAQLLWMVQELDEEGNPVPYVMYDERTA